MNDTPTRKEALDKLRADLLEFVVKELKTQASGGKIEELSQPFMDKLRTQIGAAVADGLAEGQGSAVAEEIVAVLRRDHPALFTGGPATGGPAADSTPPSGGRHKKIVPPSGQSQSRKRSWLGPASTYADVIAVVLAVVLIGLGVTAAYGWTAQQRELGDANRLRTVLVNDIDQACGIFSEVAREVVLLEDQNKTLCGAGVTGREKVQICNASDKMKRWLAKKPASCTPPGN